MEKEIDSIIIENGDIVITINKKSNKFIYDEFKDFDRIDALAHLYSLIKMKNILFNNPGPLKLHQKLDNEDLSKCNPKYLKELENEIIFEISTLLSAFDYKESVGLFDLGTFIGINENNMLSLIIYYSKSLNLIKSELEKRS